jgi:transcriptional regulator with XRE-family HTH domain
MPFAEKLAKLRKEKGFTQQEFAQKVGVGVTQIKRYEGGKSSPTLEVIKNIAKILGISADDLIFDEGEGVASAKIIDQKLLKQFELISSMDLHDQYAIKTILESMIVKSRLEEVMPSQKDEVWSKEMQKVVSELRKGASKYTDDEIDDIVDEAVKAVRAEERHRSRKVEA